MGPKVTIDSATLMNKGLEVIEARWLFGIEGDRIRVVIHPQSVIHSMIELVDGSFKAQLGPTDMRHPIQYALSWPERWESRRTHFDPLAAGALEFEAPDLERFPCLALAYAALERGAAAPAVMNAANEIAVQAFLDGNAGFDEIPAVVSAVVERHGGMDASTLAALVRADAVARETARSILEQRVGS
jgi:1-deoxy-D-xylulose-5-phosphate reductoisomerase